MSNKGWECPKCSKCYAPHVDECKNCNNSAYIPQDPFTPANPSPWTLPDPIVVPLKWEAVCNCHLKNGMTGIWCPVHDTTITITSDNTNWGGQTSIHWPFGENESEEERDKDECESCAECCKCADHD